MAPIEHAVWLNDTTFPVIPAAPLPERVDVVVIGAGIAGLAAACALAQRGLRVAVLEAQSIGWGASSRNGGMVLTGLKLGAADLLRAYGPTLARQLFATSLQAIDCVEQIVTAERIDCQFRRCGHLLVASKPSHTQPLQREAELVEQHFDHRCHFVPREQLSSEIGTTCHYGGLVDETSAGIHPARYVAGLAAAALSAGAQIYERTPVQKILRVGSSHWLYTPHGLLRAEAIFVACGGYPPPSTPFLQHRVFPLGSYSIATEPLPETLAHELSPRDRMIFDSLHLLSYFRLTPDRRMLFGGRAAFFPESAETVGKSATILRRMMLAVYPQLQDARVEYAWGGQLDVTFDLMPHTGQRDGLFFATGYAGHGVAMATYLGTLMAATIAGDQPDNPFAELPFPTAPLGLYSGRPWFLPLAAAWYRFLDAVS